MKVVIGNDHGATHLKEVLKNYLIEKGNEVIDLGIKDGEKVDYPLKGEEIAHYVLNSDVDFGIALCGTGIGISISCNKVKGIRAAVCSEPYSAKMSKEHNNANILCMGGRVVGDELAKMILDAYMSAHFLGDRHQRRVDLISNIEAKN